MHWKLADGSLCLPRPSASAARASLLWRTRVCSFKDPASAARSKGLLAGINYIPGLLGLADYLQLLHPGASPRPREGEAPSAPPPPSEGKQGVTANATWSGRHFSQMPAEPSLGRREKKRGKNGNQEVLPAETNVQPMLRICLQNSGRTLQEGHSPWSSQAWGKEDGTRSRCPSD